MSRESNFAVRQRGPMLPKTLIVIAALSSSIVILPMLGLASQAPWSDFFNIAARPATLKALGLSLFVSLSAASICLAGGLPLGLLLARGQFRGRGVVRALVLLPLVAPPVVGGTALLAAFGRDAFLGRALARFGVSLPFTTAGAVLAATFVALPLVIIAIENGARASEHRYEEAAETLGASPFFSLRNVTLPLLGPHLIGGFCIAWARALGEFGATVTFAGNVPGRTQTLPLAISETLKTDPDGALILAVLLLMLSAAALIGLRGRLFSS